MWYSSCVAENIHDFFERKTTNRKIPDSTVFANVGIRMFAQNCLENDHATFKLLRGWSMFL